MLRPGKPLRLFIPALAGALLLGLHASAIAAGDGQPLYQQAVVADDQVSYSGTLTSVVYEGDHAASTVARIEHKAPASWRIWYLAPADAYGRMIVSNESLTYQYEPARNLIYSHDWSETAAGIDESVNAAQVIENYSVEIGPASSIAGRSATTLSLVSKHTGTLVQRIWVDNKTKLILRREKYHPDGTVGFKSSFDNIRIGANLPQELFSLTVPKGMTLVRGAAYAKSTTNVAELLKSINFKFADPKYLPDGFVLKKGRITSQNGIDTVQLVYGDGLRTFSLFENATGRMPSFDRATPKMLQIGDSSAEYADVEGQTLASWNTGGLNFTIVGDLSTREIALIGASIKTQTP